MGRHEDPCSRTVLSCLCDDAVYDRPGQVRPFHLQYVVLLYGWRDHPDDAVGASLLTCGLPTQNHVLNERQFAEPFEALLNEVGFRGYHVRNNTHSVSNKQ